MKLVNVKEYRESAGLTYADTASKAGCTEKTIYNIERGVSTTLNTAKRIAKALKVDLANLIDTDLKKRA